VLASEGEVPMMTVPVAFFVAGLVVDDPATLPASVPVPVRPLDGGFVALIVHMHMVSQQMGSLVHIINKVTTPQRYTHKE
jgi:hypothetical protein